MYTDEHTQTPLLLLLYTYQSMVLLYFSQQTFFDILDIDGKLHEVMKDDVIDFAEDGQCSIIIIYNYYYVYGSTCTYSIIMYVMYM